MNSVNITGRLTCDPKVVDTKTDTELVILRVAVFQRGQKGVAYCDVKVFGKQAAACAAFFCKGRLIGISGRLAFDEWTAADGSRRSRLCVIAERVQFVDHPVTPSDAAESSEPA